MRDTGHTDSKTPKHSSVILGADLWENKINAYPRMIICFKMSNISMTFKYKYKICNPVRLLSLLQYSHCCRRLSSFTCIFNSLKCGNRRRPWWLFTFDPQRQKCNAALCHQAETNAIKIFTLRSLDVTFFLRTVKKHLLALWMYINIT